MFCSHMMILSDICLVLVTVKFSSWWSIWLFKRRWCKPTINMDPVCAARMLEGSWWDGTAEQESPWITSNLLRPESPIQYPGTNLQSEIQIEVSSPECHSSHFTQTTLSNIHSNIPQWQNQIAVDSLSIYLLCLPYCRIHSIYYLHLLLSTTSCISTKKDN